MAPRPSRCIEGTSGSDLGDRRAFSVRAKTAITHIDEGFEFLGFRIQRHTKRGTAKRFVYTYPSKALNAEQITATPRKLAALEQASNEALLDSNPALADIVGMSLVRSIGLKFDHGVYEGSGSAPEIRGLKNVTGIQTVSMGTNGAALANLDPFADALGSLEDYSAASDEAVFVMSPRTARAVAKLKEQPTGNNKPLVVPEGRAGAPAMTIYGGPVYVSAQLSVAETQGTANNASSVYCYVPSEVVAVMRQDVRVERDSSRLFNSDQSELRAIMRSDVVVPNPKAVVRVLGIIP